LHPIVCVGERLEERESGRTDAVLREQFDVGIAKLSPEQFSKIVIAYEPVWAIGTGKTATPEIAQEAHSFIRSLAKQQYGEQTASKLRILYGGSVKPDNTKSLMSQPDLDGVLVGGASLDPASFAAIVNF
jgi:triosephosphate isomerase